MIKTLTVSEKKEFNRLARHPLQSWEWGEFRLKTGIETIRLGRYEKNKLVETAQLTLHPIPFTIDKIGYLPKGRTPSLEMLISLTALGKKENVVFIKFEPDILKTEFDLADYVGTGIKLVKSPHPLFTRFTFKLDLTQDEDVLLSKMHPKTRYNLRLAEKKGIKIIQENSREAFEEYLKLLEETTLRQKFYAHTRKYHELMWETLSKTGIAKLFSAKYEDGGNTHTLVSWVLFLFNGVLYYPYGASSTLFRNFMPSNLMMWEAIKFGKKMKASSFDMWGALGPNPDPKDPWYGFHKFKEGYGATLTELSGSYDLVINPFAYFFYNFAHGLRELFLKLKR